MGGMRFGTAYNHRERALSGLADLYSSAALFGMTSKAMGVRANEIKATIEHCPHWVKSYIDGWERHARSVMQRQHIFCYVLEDGRMFSVHRDRADYYAKHGIGPKEIADLAVKSGHYWEVSATDRDGNRTLELRPYFVQTEEDMAVLLKEARGS